MEQLKSINQLEEMLSRPDGETIEMCKKLEGDVIILGVSGKMGPTLGDLFVRAFKEAGVPNKVYGVARFSDEKQRTWLEEHGIETIACDLSDPDAVKELPWCKNVFFLAGRKFGDQGSEPLTWLMNTVMPGNVGRYFKGSTIVAFSTGCVYALSDVESGGSKESDGSAPIGEYASSCLGRERVFEYFCQKNQSPTLLYRLNYAVDVRYGVIVDVARAVWNDQPVDLTVRHANIIWQGDAVNHAARCLLVAGVPAVPLNITGPEMIDLKEAAEYFGKLFSKQVTYKGTGSGKGYLSNASKSFELLGKPKVDAETLVKWVGKWMLSGNETLDKPTHFSVTDGQFLD